MNKFFVGDIFALHITNRWIMGIIKEYDPVQNRYLMMFPSIGEIWFDEDKLTNMRLVTKSYLRGKYN